MPLFRGEVINGICEESEGPEDEFEEVDREKGQKRDAEMAAATMNEEYADLPHPTIIDAGTAELVIPANQCPLTNRHHMSIESRICFALGTAVRKHKSYVHVLTTSPRTRSCYVRRNLPLRSEHAISDPQNGRPIGHGLSVRCEVVLPCQFQSS